MGMAGPEIEPEQWVGMWNNTLYIFEYSALVLFMAINNTKRNLKNQMNKIQVGSTNPIRTHASVKLRERMHVKKAQFPIISNVHPMKTKTLH